MKVDLVLFSRIDAYSTVTNFSCDTLKFYHFESHRDQSLHNWDDFFTKLRSNVYIPTIL